MKRFATVVAAVLSLFAVPLLAANPASPMKPGKWEISVQMDMPGMSMPAHTMTKCVTKEEIADAQNAIPKGRNESDCKMKDVKVDGNTLTWKMNCDARQITGEGKMVFESETYTGEAHIKMPEHEMTMKYTGKRLGDCEK